MAELDPRIILGSRPLPSPQDMAAERSARDVQQQELELRRQEIMARRDEMIERARLRANPQADPLKQKQALEYSLFKGQIVADMLQQAKDNPDLYPHVRQYIGQTVGQEALTDLPEQYDPVKVDGLISTGRAHLERAKGALQAVETIGADGKPVKKFVVPSENAEYPIVPKAETEGNPTEAALALRAASGDASAAAALRIIRQQHPVGGGNEPLQAIIGPDGRPVLVTRSQAVGKQPASSREQGRAVTSGDAGRIADYDTSLNDLATLTKTIPPGTTGVGAKAGAALPNFVTQWTGIGADAKSKQAVIDRVKQVIGKALEGGVLRKEDEYKYEKILPTIGDVDSVVKAKLEGLQSAITQRRQTQLEALEDAGYDTSRFQSRKPAGAKADPLGIR